MMKTNGLTIWAVEDDVYYQQVLLSYLNLIGYSAIAFNEGEAMMNAMQSQQPDVILLDHNLGTEMTGLDILRNIKMIGKDIHVIYITGEDKVSIVSEAYNAGSEDYIGKDSASLLRLKLRLEKIELFRNQILRKNKMRKIALGLLLAGMVAVSAFLLFNSANN